MNIPAVLRIAAQPVSKTEAVPRAESGSRSDSTRGRANHSGQTFSSASQGQQSAVVQFGSQALGLARENEGAEGTSTAGETGESGPLSEAPEFEAVESNDNAGNSNGSESRDNTNGDTTTDSNTGQQDEQLSPDEQLQVSELRSRDREVRTHEQAHKASGAGHTGNIQLQFELGPDGKRYAVAGSVSIDSSGVSDDAEATLRKMEVVQRAALAPASPSGADRQVASAASRQAQQARSQIAAERYAETQEQLGEQLPEPKTSGPADSTTQQGSRAGFAGSQPGAPAASPFRLVA